jgi:transcriptional regulator with XRE-family HTH domain
MSGRYEPVHRGEEKGRAAWDRVRREIRHARLSQGKSQALAARQAGIDPATWNRIEKDRLRQIDFKVVGRMAAVVGLDFTINLYPAPRRLYDGAHLELQADIRHLFGPAWAWRSEVLVGLPPDQRAWDLGGTHPETGLHVRVDAESVFNDCQAVMRRVEAKRVADGCPRVVLAVRASRGNRRAVNEALDALRTAFPIDARTGLAALRQGLDPGGDVLLLVDWHRKERGVIHQARDERRAPDLPPVRR